MKKIMNQPSHYVSDMLEGLLYSHPDELRSIRDDNRALVRKNPKEKGKVGIVTGGGSGHLPLFLGYIGKGMLDGAAVGEIFASPSAKIIMDVTRHVHQGAGVLYIYGNYGGDVLNFDFASELAADEEIEVETVLGTDDVASMPIERAYERRGVAGIFYLFKLAGAAAERGYSLQEVKKIAEKANQSTRSMGIALGACTLPEVGKPHFILSEDEMEIGMGIHGEPGILRGKLEEADSIAERILESIRTELNIAAGSKISVLINGLGATPLEEQYIVARRIHQVCSEANIMIVKTFVGEYATSLEMMGLSISVCVLDDELEALLLDEFRTPFHRS